MVTQKKSRPFNPPWAQIPIEEQAWRKQFRHQKLHIEIGAGVGYHAIQAALKSDDEFIIAIERTTEKFKRFQQRVIHHPQLNHLLALQACAIQWIWQNIQAETVDKYSLMYPNPYPKAKQANQRFHNMPFFNYLLSTLKPSGSLVLVSDRIAYVDEAKEVLSDHKNISVSLKQVSPQQQPRTHFEKKYLERGLSCYELQLIKD